MNDEVKVSVFCIVYNHEQYLEQCLSSLVNQKTNFKYEIIVHDDASTDNSKNIILDYYNKYPDLIVPIIQEVNQVSLKINPVFDVVLPKAKGKYIAFCEGDDSWCSENKLQMQYDFMEEHPECSMCLHNTTIHDLSNKSKDKLFNNWKEIHEMTEKEVFSDWKVHTTSYFMKKEVMDLPEFAKKCWMGDYVKLVKAFSIGKVFVLPEIMSIYNYNNKNGLVYVLNNKSNERRLRKTEVRKKFLIAFNEYTNNKLSDPINSEINYLDVELLKLKLNDVKTHEEFKKVKGELLKNKESLKNYFARNSMIDNLKFKAKYHFYVILKLENWVKNKFLKR